MRLFYILKLSHHMQPVSNHELEQCILYKQTDLGDGNMYHFIKLCSELSKKQMLEINHDISLCD